MSPRLMLAVPATLEGVDQTLAAARAWLAAERPGVRDYELCLVLREAVVNAVRHGARPNDFPSVAAELWLEGARVHARVRDPGTGFDWRTALARVPEEMAPSGRGLWIMRQGAEVVEFNEDGNELHLCCLLGPGPETSEE